MYDQEITQSQITVNFILLLILKTNICSIEHQNTTISFLFLTAGHMFTDNIMAEAHSKILVSNFKESQLTNLSASQPQIGDTRE